MKRTKFITGLLWCCIALGLACRFAGLNWDAGFHLHPDERFLCIITPSLEWPRSLPEYFATQQASLNPFRHGTDFFVYGQFPLVLTKFAAALCGRDDYDGILLIGRFLSALFDTFTVLLVWRIGHRLGGSRWLGLLAAAFLSLTALHIQHAHFWVVDTFAAFFLVAAFYLVSETRGQSPGTNWKTPVWKTPVMCGFCLGAATACKISSALFLAVIVIFTIFHWRHANTRLANARALCLILICAFLAFRVLHPVAFRGEGGVLTLWGLLDMRLHPQFWSALAEQQNITSGAVEVPFNYQWFGRTTYLWPLKNLGNWALGWPLLSSGIAGITLAATRLLRRHAMPPAILLAVFWCVLVFGFYGAQFSKFTRYYLAATPFLALCAAWFWCELFHCAPTRKAKIVIATFIGGVLGATLVWALMVTSIYRRPHPRVAVTNWILRQVPAGATIANETAWDDVLPLREQEKYRRLDLRLFEADNEKKRRHLLQTLDATEWIFVSSPRVWKTVPRLQGQFPLTSEYYRALFDGRLGFRLEKEFRSHPQVFGFRINDENVEEALTVYDHPRVLLFRKTKNYSPRTTAEILHSSLTKAKS